MNEGLFKSQINAIPAILKNLDLFEDINHNPRYPSNPRAVFKHLDYVSIWTKCFAELYFDFQLIDDSLLQFKVDSYNPLAVSYVYYECPFVPMISFQEYLRDVQEIEDWDSPHHRRRDYEEFYMLVEKKEMVTPIRYDYSTSIYNAGLHPASHIHFGYDSNIRVGTRKVLRPLSFLCFILRQVYPEYWQTFVKLQDAPNLVRNVREHLDDVHKDYWEELDDWEMSLI